MIKHDAPTPLYVQIQDYIQLNIENGVYSVDEKIPSERQLAAQFGVNRLTVSKAIHELAQDGLVYSRVGKGTFVAATKIRQPLQTLTGFTEDMHNRQKIASSRVLDAGVEPVNEDVAKALSILPSTAVMVLHRVRLANEKPMALEKATISHALCPNIIDNHDFSQESLYRVLQENYNIQVAYAHQTIEARFAGADILEPLEAAANTPILFITRVTYTADDQPVEYVRSSYRGDRYKFHTILRTLE
ncbi:GntR family transcriptional regulator [Chloroflexota bacterium]